MLSWEMDALHSILLARTSSLIRQVGSTPKFLLGTFHFLTM